MYYDYKSLRIFNYLMVHLNIALKRVALITYVSAKSLEDVVFFLRAFRELLLAYKKKPFSIHFKQIN